MNTTRRRLYRRRRTVAQVAALATACGIQNEWSAAACETPRIPHGCAGEGCEECQDWQREEDARRDALDRRERAIPLPSQQRQVQLVGLIAADPALRAVAQRVGYYSVFPLGPFEGARPQVLL